MSGSSVALDRNTALTRVPAPLDPSIVQQVLLGGDLSRLTPEQRVSFYNRVCESVGLNPLTQPFAYLKLNGKEVLYAKKDATEQLRFLHQISVDPKTFSREVIEGVYIVTASASMPSGRTDVSTGAVPIDGLKGEARANAMMKAETKAKRRVTLSICGLGMLDETEVESIRNGPVLEAAYDASLSQSGTKDKPAAQDREQPVGFPDWLLDLESVAVEGTEALKQAWFDSPVPMRSYLMAVDKERWEGLKAKAAQAHEIADGGLANA